MNWWNKSKRWNDDQIKLIKDDDASYMRNPIGLGGTIRMGNHPVTLETFQITIWNAILSGKTERVILNRRESLYLLVDCVLYVDQNGSERFEHPIPLTLAQQIADDIKDMVEELHDENR